MESNTPNPPIPAILRVIQFPYLLLASRRIREEATVTEDCPSV